MSERVYGIDVPSHQLDYVKYFPLEIKVNVFSSDQQYEDGDMLVVMYKNATVEFDLADYEYYEDITFELSEIREWNFNGEGLFLWVYNDAYDDPYVYEAISINEREPTLEESVYHIYDELGACMSERGISVISEATSKYERIFNYITFIMGVRIDYTSSSIRFLAMQGETIGSFDIGGIYSLKKRSANEINFTLIGGGWRISADSTSYTTLNNSVSDNSTINITKNSQGNYRVTAIKQNADTPLFDVTIGQTPIYLKIGANNTNQGMIICDDSIEDIEQEGIMTLVEKLSHYGKVSYFKDIGESDKTSNYDTVVSLESQTGATLTYDSNEKAYSLTSTNSGVKVFPIKALSTRDRFKVRCDVRIPTVSTNSCCGLTIVNKSAHSGIGMVIGRSSSKLNINVHSFDNNAFIRNEEMRVNTLYYDDYYTLEMIVIHPNVVWNCYDKEGNLLRSVSKDLSLLGIQLGNIAVLDYGLDIGYANISSYNFYVKNIIAQKLGINELTFKDKGVLGKNNTNYGMVNDINVLCNSNGTKISTSTYNDSYYYANELVSGDFYAEFLCVNVVKFGGIAWLNTDKEREWCVEYSLPTGLVFSKTSDVTMTTDTQMGRYVGVERIGTTLTVYLDNQKVGSSQVVSDTDGYIGFKTHSQSSRSITFKDFNIWKL